MTSPKLQVDKLLDDQDTKVIVCCGSGGVGKTTSAAALALRAAERGRQTVVLTIDPARRLAQALGLKELGNHPRQVQLPDWEPAGELWAMMLDMRRTFDDMVLTHAGKERAEQLLANPFYQTISTSFSGTQEYMAMEKLGQLAATGEWDLIVVDTPPSRSALDFLDAPQRLSSALDSRLLRMLAAPARASGRGIRKLVGTGFTLFTKAISTILGGQLLTDASAFMQAFDSMFGGFRERAEKTAKLLSSPGTAFLVVAAPEPDALREAGYFVDRLDGEDMPLAGLIVNRTHPVLAKKLTANKALAAAESLEREDSAAPSTSAMLRIHADRVEQANREQRLLARFTRAHPIVSIARVPAMARDVHDVAGLRAIGDRLAGD
ncbi:arsenite efflux ATP-binding protein ArsA [Tamaricihabitans halophyticus]|uniref:Arsenite efflux ATP-binding protein ArsA n=1 Tax=Tamaricihabitans halophyticus TaxID=1262583 RepID=A0A4R2R4N7_9PSEU|nr:ArsA family ATPase [Tamaricihabitans halophyticus]TCP56884.1 arsenite efflux ATP-binding protein ArsA [Tamaricihabitans halophyticus]